MDDDEDITLGSGVLGLVTRQRRGDQTSVTMPNEGDASTTVDTEGDASNTDVVTPPWVNEQAVNQRSNSLFSFSSPRAPPRVQQSRILSGGSNSSRSSLGSLLSRVMSRLHASPD